MAKYSWREAWRFADKWTLRMKYPFSGPSSPQKASSFSPLFSWILLFSGALAWLRWPPNNWIASKCFAFLCPEGIWSVKVNLQRLVEHALLSDFAIGMLFKAQLWEPFLGIAMFLFFPPLFGKPAGTSDLSGPVLRDTARLSQSQRYPPIARYGIFGVSTWPIGGCDTPSPFSERFPLGEHAKWRCDTPTTKGVSQRYLHDTLQKQGNSVRYPPLRYYLERVLRDMGGGISHWAAKLPTPKRRLRPQNPCLIGER